MIPSLFHKLNPRTLTPVTTHDHRGAGRRHGLNRRVRPFVA